MPAHLDMPLRLGTTSFIYPGGWLHNVDLLADRFSDIEILFFESQGAKSFPGRAELEAMASRKRAAGLTYSLHTPLDVSLASEDESRRLASVEAVCRAIEIAQPIAPENHILHVYYGDRERDPAVPSDVVAWRRRAARSLEAILRSGVDSRDLSVEVLDYDFRHLEPVVEDLDLSIALDIGHVVRDGGSELSLLDRYFERTRVIQWHGVDESGRDHRSLFHYPRDRARRLLETLREREYGGVLTLEVFREHDLKESMEVLDSLRREVW